MTLHHDLRRLSARRPLFLGLSVVAFVVCVVGGVAHYRKATWGDPWQPIGWLLSMLFLLAAFTAGPGELARRFKSLANRKAAFFFFLILLFVISHLWNFRTSPWNGDSLFDESGWDLWFLKSYVIGHPYQAAWFHPPVLARETLFHYYVWAFLRVFGFNILSYQAALFCIWLTTFVFTLLLVDLFFESYIVTSVAALILNFLPFAFIYAFAGYRYPMAVALAVVSLFFLHVGFRNGSRFYVSLGGIAAGLCLASSISGKQYLLGLAVAAPLYALFYWRSLQRKETWSSLALGVYGFLAAAAPIGLYIVFNQHDYTYYESAFLREFWRGVQTVPFPNGIRPFAKQLYDCFFTIPAVRFFIPDVLPIPLPYYWLLVPGIVLAIWQKRFEIVLLATIPVFGAFIARAIENRLLLPIPFWVILMSFTVAWVLKLRRWPGVQIVACVVAALILLDGLVPSVRYIYGKTKDPYGIRYYAQHEVAVSRFLRHVVAGQEHPGPPHLERNELNRIEGVPDAAYDTFVCQDDAYSIIHLFLRDYDDDKILSFCDGYPFSIVMTEQDVWNHNKKAISTYIPNNKSLKLIWERRPKTERIIRMFQSLHDFGTEDSLSFSFGGKTRTFYVLNIPRENIPNFQQSVSAFPATPEFSSQPESPMNMFKGGKGTGKGQFDAPTGITVDGSGNVLVADTNNGRIEKLSATGTFLGTLGTKGIGAGQLRNPNGIAVDRTGNIYVADASNHRVQKMAPDGTLIAEWKGPDPGFYGPRRVAIGPDDSIYVVDQGHNRIAKLNSNGDVLATWGRTGNGDGEFNDPTSVAVDPATNKVYVADPINKRIQVFDQNGRFLSKWSMPEWGAHAGFEDLAIDSQRSRLYASSAHWEAVFVFDLNGTRIGSLTPKPPDKLEGPSALALANGKLYVLNMASNRVSVIDLL